MSVSLDALCELLVPQVLHALHHIVAQQSGAIQWL